MRKGGWEFIVHQIRDGIIHLANTVQKAELIWQLGCFMIVFY